MYYDFLLCCFIGHGLSELLVTQKCVFTLVHKLYHKGVLDIYVIGTPYRVDIDPSVLDEVHYTN